MQTVPGTTGLSGDPFGFGGRFGYYTDSETRLVLCGQRYYDPGAARWLTRDPIGLFGGVNPYAYCGNNPVGAADPSGELYGVFSLGAVAQVLAPGMGADVSLLIGANGIALSSDVYTGMGKGVGWSAGGGIGFASGDVPIGAHYSSTAGIVGFADVGVGFSGGASRPITDSSKLDSVKDLLADVAGTGGFGRMGVGDGFGVMGTSGFSGSVGVSWAPVNSAINAVETEGNTLLTGIVAGIYNLDGLNGLTGLTGETDQSGPCPWG